MTLFSIIMMIKLNGSHGHLKQQLLLCSRRVRRFQKAKGFTFGAVLLESQKKKLAEAGTRRARRRPRHLASCALARRTEAILYRLKRRITANYPLSWSDI